MIRIIILAAGESRRMGRQKMLLPFGESSVIETVVRNALGSIADETIVVLGSDAEEVQGRIRHLPVTVLVNHEFRRGMFSSILCGSRALPPDTRAVVLMLGDQPRIPPSIVNGVIDAWEGSGAGMVLPVHDGRRGHPLLIDMRYRERILRIDPDSDMRALLRAHAEDILEIPVDCPAVLRDIDTPEDYDAELRASHGTA